MVSLSIVGFRHSKFIGQVSFRVYQEHEEILYMCKWYNCPSRDDPKVLTSDSKRMYERKDENYQNYSVADGSGERTFTNLQ